MTIEPTPDIRVERLAVPFPIEIIDADARLVRCPSPGCGDTAHVEDDGRIACPTGDAISAYLAGVAADLDAWVDREIESMDRADAEGRGPRGILNELAAGRDPFGPS